MSDLSDLAADVTKDLPVGVRKVIDAAMASGWQLGKPGMSLCLRLNHPTDPLALPVYVAWTVGRTPKGALSFRFDSCCTSGLNPLSGADLLEYLGDPTVIYPLDDAESDAEAGKETPAWDSSATPLQNLTAQLGGTVIKPLRVIGTSETAKAPSPAPASPLRV